MGKLLFSFRDEKGMAAVVAFSVLFILLALGSIFLFTMDTEFKIGTNQKESTQALYIAEAGLQWGLLYLNDNPDWRTNEPPNEPVVHQLEMGQYTVKSENELDGGAPTGFILLTSTGEVESLTQKGVKATRKVRLKLASSSFKYALLADSDDNPAIDDIGKSTVTGLIDGDIHANGSINQAVKNIVKPGNNITEGDAGDPKVTWPTIDMSYYEDSNNFPGVNHVVYNVGTVFNQKNYDDTVYYVKGQALIDLRANTVTFTNCILIAEGASTTATDPVGPGDTAVPVDSVDPFLSSGKASIEGDDFNYTEKDNTTTPNLLKGVTGIDSDHAAGASVTADEAIIIGQPIEGDIRLDSGPSFEGGNKEVLFGVRNDGSLDITINRLSATWTSTQSLMQRVDMPDLSQQWTGSAGRDETVYFDNDVVLYASGQPGNTQTVRLYFSKGMKSDMITVTFYDTSGIAYPVSLTPGDERLRFTAMEGHPALATKERDIFESGSTARQDRDIKGIIYSEQGEVKFQYLTLDGEIIASQINLVRNVDIMYKPQWVPESLPGVIGGISEVDWQEIY